MTPLAQREHVVYRLYDGEGALLYVGMSSDPPQRFRQHASRAHWWAEVDPLRTRYDHYPSQDSARVAEAAVIRGEGPRFNDPDWKPKGMLNPEDVRELLAAKAAYDALPPPLSAVREVAVELLGKYSFRTISKATGLSTNTLQRWKREQQ